MPELEVFLIGQEGEITKYTIPPPLSCQEAAEYVINKVYGFEFDFKNREVISKQITHDLYKLSESEKNEFLHELLHELAELGESDDLTEDMIIKLLENQSTVEIFRDYAFDPPVEIIIAKFPIS